MTTFVKLPVWNQHKFTGAVRSFIDHTFDVACWEVTNTFPINDSTARSWRIKRGMQPVHAYAVNNNQ